MRQPLYELGFSAALETFTTNTQSLAGIWVKLFQSFLASPKELRWLDNGPGIGRDAKVAYSGLFGRYMARAHLMFRENVRVLIPLEVIRKELQNNNLYYIGKKPGSNGLEADWIGIDDEGLIIAETKGSFDRTKSSWKGNKKVPQLLHNAINQAMRTEVYIKSTGKPLPARYWAVASRWANEDNGVEPTTIAWSRGRVKLEKTDYWNLENLLLRVDLNSLMKGLGHPEIDNLQQKVSGLSVRYRGDLDLMINGQPLGPGFITAVGPIQNYPLRTLEDIEDVHELGIYNWFLSDSDPYIVLISVSSQFIDKVLQNQIDEFHGFPSRIEIKEIEEGLCIVKFAGLTVVWCSLRTNFYWEINFSDGDLGSSVRIRSL